MVVLRPLADALRDAEGAQQIVRAIDSIAWGTVNNGATG
jgi:hypothetical protein